MSARTWLSGAVAICSLWASACGGSSGNGNEGGGGTAPSPVATLGRLSSAEGAPKVYLSVGELRWNRGQFAVHVENPGNSPVTECGYCWGPTEDVSWVGTKQLGPAGQRCVRQLQCVNGTYFTDDGFMDQARWEGGERYFVAPYAFNAAGIGYGELRSVFAAGPRTDWMGFSGGVDLLGGRYAPPGEDSIECGVCWGTRSEPTLVFESSNAPGDSIRCVRVGGSASEYFVVRPTDYDEQAPIDYLPGVTYAYRAYDFHDGEIRYGGVRWFTAGVDVITGEADEISTTRARLGGSVVATGPLVECGVCWSVLWGTPMFVGTKEIGSEAQRCMRQLECRNRDYAYYTDDGFMDQLPYNPGTSYRYQAYAMDVLGRVHYGVEKIFTSAE